jgi:hypothetical protein
VDLEDREEGSVEAEGDSPKSRRGWESVTRYTYKCNWPTEAGRSAGTSVPYRDSKGQFQQCP